MMKIENEEVIFKCENKSELFKEFSILTVHLINYVKKNYPKAKNMEDDEILYWIFRAGSDLIKQ